MEELRGEEAGMKAEPAKAEEGREEGKEGGRGGEQQSKAAGTQTETKRKKKTDFLSTGSRERTFYVFI